MLKTGRGNQLTPLWASLFTYLAREVGYDVKTVVGTGVSPKGSESVHAWTEITIDGTALYIRPADRRVFTPPVMTSTSTCL